jgi:restriction system protein
MAVLPIATLSSGSAKLYFHSQHSKAFPRFQTKRYASGNDLFLFSVFCRIPGKTGNTGAEKLRGRTHPLTHGVYLLSRRFLDSSTKSYGEEKPNRYSTNNRYEKSGYIRWQSILHFYTIDTIKAGFLRKQKGVWILTAEGEEAMQLGPIGLLDKASEAYKTWKEKTKESDIEVEQKDVATGLQSQKANLELIQEQALTGLRDYIKKLNPYEFQDLVAALLHGMGYFISFIAPRGKDNGLDIIAYQDPLGTKTPRIKVQVKHRPEYNIPLGEIKSLMGSLSKDGDVGLFVTSGRFTSEAESFARSSHIHVELIDFERFIALWDEFYDKLSDEDKNRLPLQRISFLGTNE